MRKVYLFSLSILFLISVTTVQAANRYWVGSGNWTSSGTSNWAAVSGGGVGYSVPNSTDNVFFDGNSGGCTILTNVDIGNIHLTGGNVSFGGASGAYSFRVRGNYTKNGGNYKFNARNSTFFDVDGDFNHSYSPFWAPSNRIMFVGGNWNRTGGSFEHMNSNVVFDGNDATVLNDEVFYSVTINKNHLKSIFLNNKTFKVNGHLKMQNGMSTTGIIEARDEFTVYPEWDGGNVHLYFLGGKLQIIDLTGATDKLEGNITIDKPNGSFALNSDLILSTTGQQAFILNGTFRLENYTFRCMNNAGTSGKVWFTSKSIEVRGPGDFEAYDLTLNASATLRFNNEANVHIYNNYIQANANSVFKGGNNVNRIDGQLLMSEGSIIATNGVMQLGGDWIRTGGSFNHNNGTMEFIGDDAIIYDTAITLNNIVMNKNSGQKLIFDSITCIRSTATLTMERGIFKTRSWFNLTMGCGADIIMINSPDNCNSESYVEGPLSRSLCADGTLFYPTAKNDNYRPVTLTTDVTTHGETIFTHEQIEDDIPAWCLPIDLCSVSKIRHFRITINQGKWPKRDPITLSYCPDDGVTNPSDLRVAKQNDTCWQNMGGAGTALGSGTITSSVEFSTYGDFILGTAECLNPLPVSLVNFRSEYFNDQVELNWSTASEENNDRFEIQRSIDGVSWEQIGMVQGFGNSSVLKHYTFLDQQVPESHKIIYYRLKQVDFDGEFAHSPIVYELISKPKLNAKNYVMYPNPASQFLTIANHNSRDIVSSFEMKDVNGKTWLNGSFKQTVTFDLTEFASGLYFIQVYNSRNEVVIRKKIIVRH